MPFTYFPPLTADTYWGSIKGSLENQADLKQALDGKADSNHTHIITLPLAIQVSGEIKVPVAGADTIPALIVPDIDTGDFNLVSMAYCLSSGTSATFSIKLNGTDIQELSGLTATTTAQQVNLSAPINIQALDKLQPEVTAVDGQPQGLSLTLVATHT